MENTQQLLEKLESANRKQLFFTKILCVICALAVICSLVVMITVSKAASALTELAEPVQALAVQAEAVLTDLGTAAESLAQVDFAGMVSQVDTLTTESQEAVAQAMEKLDAIDIETLNKAIADLAQVVEPLAKLTNIW